MVEIVEKSLECYKQHCSESNQLKDLEKYVKVVECKKFSHPNETFTCDKCGASFQNETAYSYSSSLEKTTKTYCGECAESK